MTKCTECDDYESDFPIDMEKHLTEWHGMGGEAAVHEGLVVDEPVAEMRTFDTGATRNVDEDKLDFEGFLSPLALKAYAEYMHKNRRQADGKLRDSDNWQKGIPKDAYMKSMWRHFFAVWEGHRFGQPSQEDLCALFFNVQGLLHEHLKEASNE